MPKRSNATPPLFIQIETDVAADPRIGIEGAIILARMLHWVRHHRDNPDPIERARHRKPDGRTWCYQTMTDWAAELPFFSRSVIYRTIQKLIQLEIILVTDKFNTRKGDKTTWYAFKDESAWLDRRLTVPVRKAPKDARSNLEQAPEACSNLEQGPFQSGTGSFQNETTLPDQSSDQSPDQSCKILGASAVGEKNLDKGRKGNQALEAAGQIKTMFRHSYKDQTELRIAGEDLLSEFGLEAILEAKARLSERRLIGRLPYSFEFARELVSNPDRTLAELEDAGTIPRRATSKQMDESDLILVRPQTREREFLQDKLRPQKPKQADWTIPSLDNPDEQKSLDAWYGQLTPVQRESFDRDRRGMTQAQLRDYVQSILQSVRHSP